MTDEMIAWGRENYPHLDGDTITAEFVDYWRAVPGAKGVKLDWIATWRNQVRRVAERSSPAASQRGRPAPGPRRATVEERMDQADQALAELKADRAAGIPAFGITAANPNAPALDFGHLFREIES